MSVRNLDAVFEPKVIALIGASNKPGSVGSVVARNLLQGGFDGLVLPVNPKERAIHCVVNFHSIDELPETPDLAVIATPPQTVPDIIAGLGKRGCRAAIVIAAGFGEGKRAAGKALQHRMLEAARPHCLRIIGPNCLGIVVPHRGINASFAHLAPEPGGIALFSQSGAVATAIIDWACARGVGFSHIVSLGDTADVDFGDLLDYAALDRKTRAIVLYVESIDQARKFMSAARTASRSKPVVVIKVGRSQAGIAAALSHTGALAGMDSVYDAAFRRAGLVRIDNLADLFDAIAVLGHGVRMDSDDLTIITNGGGLGVLAADKAGKHNIALRRLDDSCIASLDKSLPATWSRGNPIDIIGDAPGSRYAAALEVVLGDTHGGAVLVLNCPTAIADSSDAATAVVKTVRAHPHRPVLTAWIGESAARQARAIFVENNIPTFATPEDAVAAHAHLVRYRRVQSLLMETPDHADTWFRPDRKRARAMVENALRQDRATLDEMQSKELLALYDIPVVRPYMARNPDEVREVARSIAAPVALKILSPDMTHKSDVGGVALNLETPQEAAEQAEKMLVTVGGRVPRARITGFTVQEMVSRPGAVELIAGLAVDPVFGPIVVFGQGGVSVEVVGDRTIGLPPLNRVLARDMISHTRVSRLLAAYRDRPAADIDAVADVLVRLAELAIDRPEIAELDINPLLADTDGVIALDARIAIEKPAVEGTARLAIEPYPRSLIHDIKTSDATPYLLRPIRPEDETTVVEMLEHCADEDIEMRFFRPHKVFDHGFVARLTQIDYDRSMSFVAVGLDEGEDRGRICGISRLDADPDKEKAEFALIVRPGLKKTGLGHRLLSELVAHARNIGLKTVWGDIMRNNVAMVDMARKFGFRIEDREPEDSMITVSVAL